MKAEITALSKASDPGSAFQSALEHSGYTLCRGDKRDTLYVVDSAGDSHALVRRIDGIKTAQLRHFMADIDPHILLSVGSSPEHGQEAWGILQWEPYDRHDLDVLPTDLRNDTSPHFLSADHGIQVHGIRGYGDGLVETGHAALYPPEEFIMDDGRLPL